MPVLWISIGILLGMTASYLASRILTWREPAPPRRLSLDRMSNPDPLPHEGEAVPPYAPFDASKPPASPLGSGRHKAGPQ